MSKKKYAAGMYGGKFLPMHKGHLLCLKTASEMCDHVFLIMFVGGQQEEEVLKEDKRDFISYFERRDQVKRAAEMFDNVIPIVLDISDCRLDNGEEDWDAETPMVINKIGYFDAVFGSEPSYADYFKRAYPWAEYVLVDPERKIVPVSSTKIRNMNTKEQSKWII